GVCTVGGPERPARYRGRVRADGRGRRGQVARPEPGGRDEPPVPRLDALLGQATGERVVVHRLAGQEAARADNAAEYCHGMFDPWAAATGSSIPAGGAAAARARLSAMPCSSPLRTESNARRRAASKANASAEP